jgi:hypothetical protein
MADVSVSIDAAEFLVDQLLNSNVFFVQVPEATE